MFLSRMLMLGVSLLGMAGAKDLYVSRQMVPAPIKGSSCMLEREACIAADVVGNGLYFVVSGSDQRALYHFDASSGKTLSVMPMGFPVCDIKFINDHQFYARGVDLTLFDLKDLAHPLQAQLPRGFVASCEDDLIAAGTNRVHFTSTQGDIMHTEMGKVNPVLDLAGNDAYNELPVVDGENLYFIDDFSNLVKLDLKTRKTQMLVDNESTPMALFADPASHLVYFSTSEPKLCLLNIYHPDTRKTQTLQTKVCATVIKKTPQKEILIAGRYKGFMVLDSQGKVLQEVKEVKPISSVEFLQDSTLCVIYEDGSLHLYQRKL